MILLKRTVSIALPTLAYAELSDDDLEKLSEQLDEDVDKAIEALRNLVAERRKDLVVEQVS